MTFIVAEFFIVIIGRFVAIVVSYYMFSCCKGSPSNKLSFREVSFLSYAAFIRGAIAFGLVLNVDEVIFPQKKIIVSTILVLVITTTIIIGSFTNIVKNLIMPSPDLLVTDLKEVDKKVRL